MQCIFKHRRSDQNYTGHIQTPVWSLSYQNVSKNSLGRCRGSFVHIGKIILENFYPAQLYLSDKRGAALRAGYSNSAFSLRQTQSLMASRAFNKAVVRVLTPGFFPAEPVLNTPKPGEEFLIFCITFCSLAGQRPENGIDQRHIG